MTLPNRNLDNSLIRDPHQYLVSYATTSLAGFAMGSVNIALPRPWAWDDTDDVNRRITEATGVTAIAITSVFKLHVERP